MPMVSTSNCPPWVAMSVVRRWRRTFSSSTTQLSLMSGCSASKVFESFCMRIMSLLLTVAMVRVWAPRLTLLRVMQVRASRAFTECCIVHSFSAPVGLQKDSYCFCVFRRQEECALITTFNTGDDKALTALWLILFCTDGEWLKCEFLLCVPHTGARTSIDSIDISFPVSNLNSTKNFPSASALAPKIRYELCW
ncbi:hypothetical protein D3C85_609640 [compost metagenome]